MTSASTGRRARSSRGAAPPPTMRRRGLALEANGACGFTICRRDRKPGRTTGTWTMPMSTATASRTIALPPIWEYLTAGGYRAAAAITADLARVTRFVAINLLFTSSPLYPPYLSPLRLPGSVNLDINTYEGWKGVDASQTYQTPSLLVDELTDLHRVPYTSDQQDLAFKQGAGTAISSGSTTTRAIPIGPTPRLRICFSTAPSRSTRRATAAGTTRACCSTT